LKAGHVIATNVPIAIAVPIAKGDINADTRIVRGIITQEVVDATGEEVDYASVVACLNRWRGNIREMHERKAVGRAIDIQLDDANKAVIVEAFISRGAEDTWLKVQDGVLGYYSIGGVGDRVTGQRSDGSVGVRVLMRAVNEVSLVDSGACPTATVSIAKFFDGAPVAQLPQTITRADAGAMTLADVDALIHAEIAKAVAKMVEGLTSSLRTKGEQIQATHDRAMAELHRQIRKLNDNSSAATPVFQPGSVICEKPVGGQIVAPEGEREEVRLAADIARIHGATEAEREATVEKLIAFQLRHGLGMTILPRG
jgi:hypothetical protein